MPPKLLHFIHYKIPSVVKHAIILPIAKKKTFPIKLQCSINFKKDTDFV